MVCEMHDEKSNPFKRAGLTAELAAAAGLPAAEPGKSLQAFLRAIPDGIHSWPHLRSKGGLITNLVQHTPPRFAFDGVPIELVELLRTPPPASVWIPTVHVHAAMLLYADALHASEESYAGWVFDLSTALYHHPMYRFLMLVLSPQRLLRGIAARWSTFHEGTSLRVDLEEKRVRCTLEVPPGFVNQRLQLYSNIVPIVAAVAATGAKNVHAESVAVDKELSFTLVWD